MFPDREHRFSLFVSFPVAEFVFFLAPVYESPQTSRPYIVDPFSTRLLPSLFPYTPRPLVPVHRCLKGTPESPVLHAALIRRGPPTRPFLIPGRSRTEKVLPFSDRCPGSFHHMALTGQPTFVCPSCYSRSWGKTVAASCYRYRDPRAFELGAGGSNFPGEEPGAAPPHPPIAIPAMHPLRIGPRGRHPPPFARLSFFPQGPLVR